MSLIPMNPRIPGEVPNVVPFTIRENPSLIHLVEEMRKWINESLVPFVNGWTESIVDGVSDEVDRLEGIWSEKVSELETLLEQATTGIGDAVQLAEAAQVAAEAARDLAELYASQAQEIQDSAFAETLQDTDSLSRTMLDGLYASSGELNNLSASLSAAIAQLMSDVSSKAEASDLSVLQNLVNTENVSIRSDISDLQVGKANQAELDSLRGAIDSTVSSVELRNLVNSPAKSFMSVGSKRVSMATGIHSAFPSHVIMPDNSIIAVYRESATEQPISLDGVIRLVKSVDGGATWSEAVTILSDVLDLRDPNISLIDGTIYLTTFKHDGSQPVGVFLSTSLNGDAWSPLVRVDSAANPRSAVSAPAVKFGSDILIPFYGKTNMSQSYDSAYVLKSANGAVWDQFTIATGGTDYQEPNISVVGSQAVALFRSGNNNDIARSASSNGSSWSAATIVISGGSGKPSLLSTSFGLLCSYRRVSDGKAVMRVSQDAGVSWGSLTVLDNEVGVMAYSHALELSPGLIAVSYAIQSNPGSSGSNGSCKLWFKYVQLSAGVSPLGDFNSSADESFHAKRTVMFDSFERPANAGAVGMSDSGHHWSSAGIGISVGNAYSVDSGVSLASVDVGLTDCEIGGNFIYSGDGGIAIIARYVSSTTYLMFTHDSAGSVARLYKVVGGTATTLFTAPTDTRNGVVPYVPYDMSMRVVGNLIRCYVDGYMALSFTLSTADAATFSGKTRHGIRLNRVSSVQSVTKFYVEAP